MEIVGRTLARGNVRENWPKVRKPCVGYRGKNWTALGNLDTGRASELPSPMDSISQLLVHVSMDSISQLLEEYYWWGYWDSTTHEPGPIFKMRESLSKGHIFALSNPNYFKIKHFLKAKLILNDQNLKINLFQKTPFNPPPKKTKQTNKQKKNQQKNGLSHLYVSGLAKWIFV